MVTRSDEGAPARPIPRRSWRDLPAAPPTADHPEPVAPPQPAADEPTQPPTEPPTEETQPVVPVAVDAAPKRPRHLRLIVAIALVVVLIAGGVAYALTRDDDNASASGPPGREPVQAVAEALAPSVVHIETAIGVGAGVVVDEGLVLTAAHVVAGVDEMTIKANDGSEQDGRVVGRAPERDLAVVALEDPESIPVAALADQPFSVGQQVVAVGSPFGFAQSVSAGVVSALDRELETPTGTLTGLIQTDTAINPGNSGGPLADLDGKVGGIATAIATASGGSEGVGFAVPIADAKDLLEEVRRNGGVDAPTVPDEGNDLGGLLGPGLDDLLGQGFDDLFGQRLDDLFGQGFDDLFGELPPELQGLLDDLLGENAPSPFAPPAPEGSSISGIVTIDPLPSGYNALSSRVYASNDERKQQTTLTSDDGTVLLLAEESPDAADRFAALGGDDVELGRVDARVAKDGNTTRYAWMVDDDVLVVLVVPDTIPDSDVQAIANRLEVTR